MTEPSADAAPPRTYLWDDNPATTDLLGFDVVVDAVTAALREAHLDPITIGVHAPWGGGKSTVLELIGKAKDKRWLVIRTNPWEYDDQLDPKGTLITEILTAISSEVEGQATLKDDIAKLVKRVSWSRLGVAVASGVLMMPTRCGMHCQARTRGRSGPTLRPAPALQRSASMALWLGHLPMPIRYDFHAWVIE